MKNELYVQYGCGLSAPVEWENFDASPTLLIQRTPVLGTLLKKKLNCNFPSNVRFGDIVKGLPIVKNSCDGIYCSHVLEHLSLRDLRAALQNTYKLLKKDGIFRCVVPDLEYAAREYIHTLDQGDSSASITFLKSTLLGEETRPVGMRKLLSGMFGNLSHLWMWDYSSLAAELKSVGFVAVRRCQFDDCEDKMFQVVEDKLRFINAVAIECKK